MREIRMLRATWRGLETGLRTTLLGHERGNPGYRQGETYGSPRQSSTLPGVEGLTSKQLQPNSYIRIHYVYNRTLL